MIQWWASMYSTMNLQVPQQTGSMKVDEQGCIYARAKGARAQGGKLPGAAY
jgi:hypothetical protein